MVVVVLPWMIWMKEETETDGPLLIEFFLLALVKSTYFSNDCECF